MFKIITIVLISVYFAFNLFLNVLRYTNRNAPIPDELKDVYDQETYLKWKKYSAEKIILSIVSDSINYVVFLILLLIDLFALVTKDIANEYLSAIVVYALYAATTIVFDVAVEYVRDMKIEDKYGFNKTTMKTFVLDQIKGFVIGNALLIGLTCLFIAIYNAMHEYTLLLFSGVLFALVLLISFLYPLFSKVFNKFTSLEEGELRNGIIKMLESHSYKVRDIKVMDASRRTTKSNAYFTGFGKSKTIVLYDNLLKAMSNEEILAVFAHEMGHGLHRDTLKNSLISLLNVLIVVALAWLLAIFPDIYADFGFSSVNYGFAFLLLSTAVMPIVSMLLGFLSSYISRKAEYRADEQAVIEGYGDSLAKALKILARENFADLNPNRLIVLLEYSHPTLLQRIRALEAKQKDPNYSTNHQSLGS